MTGRLQLRLLHFDLNFTWVRSAILGFSLFAQYCFSSGWRRWESRIGSYSGVDGQTTIGEEVVRYSTCSASKTFHE